MEENRKNDCDLIEWSTPMSSPHKPFRNTNGIPRDNRDNRGRFTSNKANGSINLILFEQTHHNENAVTIPASASLSTGDSGSYSTTQDEENCADGILEIEAPKILNDSDDDILEGRGEALDLDDEAVGLAGKRANKLSCSTYMQNLILWKPFVLKKIVKPPFNILSSIFFRGRLLRFPICKM